MVNSYKCKNKTDTLKGKTPNEVGKNSNQIMYWYSFQYCTKTDSTKHKCE